jgi:hypothetical protein
MAGSIPAFEEQVLSGCRFNAAAPDVSARLVAK